MRVYLTILSFALTAPLISCLVPFIDGGKGMPKLYDGWFNDQIAKQASTAVSKAISAGKVRTMRFFIILEVYLF